MSVTIEESNGIKTITGTGYLEAIQLADMIRFLQSPNANRLGLFAEIGVCSNCGHLILLKKDDGKFYHVEINREYLGVDANKQLHLSCEFRFEKECGKPIYEPESVDPISGVSYPVVDVCCTCNNPEPLEFHGYEKSTIISSFKFLGGENHEPMETEYELLPLPKRPLRQPSFQNPIDKLMEPDEKDDKPKKKESKG